MSKKTSPLDAATLWRLARLGAPSISPCGRQAVASVTTFDADKNQGTTRLWRLHTDGSPPRELTTCGDKDGQPAWSPRGDRIAFVARRRDAAGTIDDTPQLYIIAADGGEARRAARFAPGIESFKWFADGRRIVFASWSFPEARTPEAQAKAVKHQKDDKATGVATSDAFHRYWDHELPTGRRLQLWLLDVDRGRITPLTAGSAYELPRTNDGPISYDVRPDGRKVCFAFDPAAESRLGQPLALAEVDVATRRVTRRAVVPGWDLDAPSYAPDGRLACLAAEAGRVHTALSRPALVAANGTLQPLATAWDRHVDSPLRWTADGSALRFAAEDRGRRHLWRLALDAADASPQVEQTGGWVQAFDAAGDTLVWLADSARHPARLWAVRGDAEPRRLERFNDAALAGVAMGEVRDIEIAGAGGEPVQVWLTFPPGFDPKKKHAAIHMIHGGPFAAAGDSFGWRWNPHVFAAPDQPGDPGRVVVQVNFHGSSGFGHAFRHSLIGRQGELELQDIEAATDWLCAQRWADRDRIVATGGSYGGFLVAWMNGHVPAWPEGRYRAYVCHAGVYDRISTFSADSWPVRPKDLGAEYWADMPRVLAQSPHAFAAAMATPTLVIHGARDYRVPDANGLAYFHTLKARGVPARLLWFPDENHWVLKPANALQWTREFRDWVTRYTAPAKRPRKTSSGR
jgi:dipeptidyl aminopeptidase/acylaminoacyl peptidase